ncbi:hypothetical protein ACFOWM_07430 [Ferruginibacter yonginensis]|uniref:Transcriptional regulator n=1 Tax=Ferruginibacter yonginensis TaxID=1310416 RepID=A0ABV8QSG7_9BACT
MSNFVTQFMLETLISSKTRIKLLLKFFLNSSTKSYLRGLEEEFGESTNSIRVELNKMEQAGLLNANIEGNKKIFTANKKHPLFPEVQQIMRKYIGIDTIIENIVKKLGDVSKVYITGNYAKGLGGDVIDLTFIGNINQPYLVELIEKVEKLINKKIRYIIYSENESANVFSLKEEQESLLMWNR